MTPLLSLSSRRFLLLGLPFWLALLSTSTFAQLPDPEVSTEYLAQIYEIDGFTTRWIPQPVNDLTVGYDLQLLSVAGVGDLPGSGNSLVVIALIGSEIHIRVFDDTGATVVDKTESELTDPPARTFLKTLLQRDPFPLVSELSEEEKKSILGKATALTDYPSPYDYPIVDSITTPSYSDQANLVYADNPGFFNIASKAGYGSGLGILSESRLPEIDSSGSSVLIRSNSIVKSRTIRQFTATSNDAAEFAADLLLRADGEMGYEYKPGIPFAFERYLDAAVDLVVRVHRSDGSVETVWEAGAVMSRTEDVDLPLNAYGDWDANDWKVNGTVATLNLFEHISSRFTVTNGETFAVEFELTARTLNYENPNSEAFVRMLNTADGSVSPGVAGGRFLDEKVSKGNLGREDKKINSADATYTVDRGFVGEYKTDSRSVKRPPSIFPTAFIDDSKVLRTGGQYMSLYSRAIASFFPNDPGGQLGGQVRVNSISSNSLASDGPPEMFIAKVVSDSKIDSRYIPSFEGDQSEEIDVDMKFVFDGIVELKANSPEAYEELKNYKVEFENPEKKESEYSKLPIYFYCKVNIESFDRTITGFIIKRGLQLGEVGLEDPAFPILDNLGNTIGQRFVLKIDSDNLGTSDLEPEELSELEDIIVIGSDEFVRMTFNLVVHIDLPGYLLPFVDIIDVNFYNTFAPQLSSDTPGVTFILADSPKDLNKGSQLNVQPIDSDSVVLSWPSEGVGDLQKSNDLDSATWEAVGLPVQDNGVLKTLIVPIGEDKQFYRLDPDAPTESGVEGESPVEKE